jgi:hypothetical protein
MYHSHFEPTNNTKGVSHGNCKREGAEDTKNSEGTQNSEVTKDIA